MTVHIDNWIKHCVSGKTATSNYFDRAHSETYFEVDPIVIIVLCIWGRLVVNVVAI